MRSIFLIICALQPLLSKAQGYSYTRYDITDGLAGSTVFCMIQDKQGFLWFGTETGVSRFDGSRFRNFSTQDGLPDNQVLTMFEDSKGRIWMAPFNKGVCYYFNGKIYNQQNDPVLRGIKLSGHMINFAEDARHNVLLMQNRRMHMIRPNNTSMVFMPSSPQAVDFICAGTNENGNFNIVESNRLYEIRNEKFEFVTNIEMPFKSYQNIDLNYNTFFWRSGYNSFYVKSRKFNKRIDFKDYPSVTNMTVISDSLVSLNLQIGAEIFDVSKNTKELYLPNESVSCVFRDREGNLWFCTFNHGVFMLNSKHISNVTLLDSNKVRLGVYTLAKYGNTWYIGADITHLFSYIKESTAAGYHLQKQWIFRDNMPERITTIVKDTNNYYWVGTDSRIIYLSNKFEELYEVEAIGAVKSLLVYRDHLLAATGKMVVAVQREDYCVRDTLWQERSTVAIEANDTIFIGTLDGLYARAKDGSSRAVGANVPQLRNRIMYIRTAADGALWIATYSGVFCYNKGRIICSITEKDGLVSNICRTLDIFGNELWVGTDKGVQKVDITNRQKPIVEYLLSNELSSEIINTVKADSTTLMVGTPEGLSIIDKKMIAFNSACDLYMDNIIVSGRKISWTGEHFNLANRDNNIRFEFAGISYRSGGDVSVQYRLKGLDTVLRQTHDNYLNYPTLPAGDYVLQMQAINKFGIKSNVVTVSFSIEPKLWQKTWFQAVFVLSIIAIGWAVFSWRIRVIRKQESEKAGILKKIADLEQLALKAQMNPHFIFNSLNSIQHYVLDKDIEGANRFITGFSRLIRQTLDISARHEITLSEEMNYLSTYLQLEQIRLENKFSFEVIAEPGLKTEECFIPPMILQPFVENCIRHGIRFRHDNNGRVSVSFKKISGYLECIVEDNGVGRKTAALHKGKNPIEYQSKGISLTTDRINLLNRGASRPIFLKIHDIENGPGDAGTRVVISFPV